MPALALVVMTLAAYTPVLSAGYIWDDELYVTGNESLRTFQGLHDIWFRLGSTTMYAPVVFTTLWAQYQLWGLNPVGYHAVTLGFHVASVLLLWRFLRKLDVGGAWLAAALFAVHPVMVESVAWITELKNGQSVFFGLLALLAFVRSRPLDGTVPPDARMGRKWYAIALLLFALALLSKPVVVTLPPVLLVIVWWKRGHVTRHDLVAIAPMLALGVAAGLLAVYVEHHFGGAVGSAWQQPALARVLVAGRALWFYAGKLAWPVDLVSVYPRWHVDLGTWWQYLFPLAAVLVTAALWRWRDRLGRGPLAAVLCFGVLVSPLVGIFNVAYHLYSFVADHFQYHAAPALLALFAAGVARLRAGGGRPLARAVDVACAALLVALATLTNLHARTFHDEKTRCLSTIDKNPGAWAALYNLGVLLKAEGKPREALRWYAEALKVTPGNPEVLNNAGMALSSLGETAEAIRHFREALRIAPAYALARLNLAAALADVGDRGSAIREYAEALRVKPDYADAHASLAKVLAADGRTEEAIRAFRESLRLRPDDADAHHNLGVTLERARRFDEAFAEFRAAVRLRQADAAIRRDFGTALANGGRPGEAIAQYEEALRLEPGRAETHNGLALARASAGQADGAARSLETALKLDPDYAEARNNLGTLLASQGRIEQAIGQYEQAIRLKPEYAEAHANLGMAWATAGRLREALAEHREAVRLEPESADYRERLGIVLAETGRLDEAIAEFERALEISPGSASARKNLELARGLKGGRAAGR
ncbi:MAG: tetratricopeptide repeat protein [Vicinamibacteria bacterium]|nr:tetratricopeptide repeat protein [Vicinamibacteria bacterium]